MIRYLLAAVLALGLAPGYAQKISADPTASALAGGEYLAGVQSGANVKILPSQILTYVQTANPFTIGNLTTTGLLLTNASGTGGAGFRLPHGAAPTSPVNGDIWTTSAGGLFARINGATVGPFGTGGGTPAGSNTYVQYNNSGAFGATSTFNYTSGTDTLAVGKLSTTGLILTPASATGGAGLRLPHGAAPTSPTDGDVWTTSAGGLFVRINGATVGPLAAGGGSLTNFTEAVNTSSPNATIPIVSLTATNAATNVDYALVPKGTGAIVARIADSGTTNGNKRGTNAVDLQRDLNTDAAAVAAGTGSFIGSGFGNKIESGADQGVIAGGYVNWIKASMVQAAITGGRQNVVGSNGGFIGGGRSNTAGNGTGNYPVIAGGNGNTANGSFGSILGGESNVASGAHSSIPGGYNVLADGQYSVAIGAYGTTRTMIGALAHSSGVPLNTTQGARQSRHATLQANTATTTAVELTSNGSAASATNQFVLPSGSGLCLRGQVVVRDPATGDVGKFNVDACWKNVSGTVSLSGTPVIGTFLGDASLVTCVVAAVADNTNKAAQITGAGLTTTALKWTFEGWSVEVGG